VELHSGQTFKSLSCCFVLIVVLGVDLITTFVVGDGRNLGTCVSLGVAFGLTCCAPITLFCATVAAAFPPHPPHPIILLPFLLQTVEYGEVYMMADFALLPA
jgi:dipeptide/tripeptide permease